jgi:hypothetical protein
MKSHRVNAGVWGLALATALVLFAARLQAEPPPATAKAEEKQPAAAAAPAVRTLAPEASTLKLRLALTKVVDIDKPFDGDLKDILEYLSDRFELTFIIDPVAFRNSDPPLDNVDSTKMNLPKLPGVKLHTVLRLLLDPIGGTYFVHGDFIEITTYKALRKKLGYQAVPAWDRTEASYLGDPVHLLAKEMPFADAVRELADASGANIVIDIRAKEQAKKPVTATLQQAPLRTAVRVLADMVELKVVALDNILYVTTPENAEKIAKEEAAKFSPPELVPEPAPQPPKKEEIPPGARKAKS